MFLFDPKWKTWVWAFIVLLLVTLAAGLIVTIYLANVYHPLWFVAAAAIGWVFYKVVVLIGP